MLKGMIKDFSLLYKGCYLGFEVIRTTREYHNEIF